jgi:hypothetical protein
VGRVPLGQGARPNARFDQLGGPIPLPSPRGHVCTYTPTGASTHRGATTARSNGATIVASLGHATPRGETGGGVRSLYPPFAERQAAQAPAPEVVADGPRSIQWMPATTELNSRCSSTVSSKSDLDSSCRSGGSRDLDSATNLDLTSTDITAVQRYGRTCHGSEELRARAKLFFETCLCPWNLRALP